MEALPVSAAIPASVISMGVLRGLLKRGTILENNVVHTIASSGESLVTRPVLSCRPWSLPRAMNFWMPMFRSIYQGGISRCATRCLIERAHGRTSS